MPLGDFNGKNSSFRHIFGQAVQRDGCYYWGPGIGSTLAVNPKFVAVALECSSGGQIVVGLLTNTGKHGNIELIKILDHKAIVLDLAWNPFNDNVLASASADCTVKVWHITDDIKAVCVRTFTGHVRKVDCIVWHNTVDNIIATCGSDGTVYLWDLVGNTVLVKINNVHATSICFNRNSSFLAATSKHSHRLFVYDARSGDSIGEGPIVHKGNMTYKVLFCSRDFLMTFGSSSINRRQLAYYNVRDLSTPLALIDIDGASGQLIPLFDPDLSIVYVTGKGDITIRCYEVYDHDPWVVYLTEHQQSAPHSSVCAIPKRALNLQSSEVMRVYRLLPSSVNIQPLSFLVPRRNEGFHPDLYPPTIGPTPAVSIDEWLAGLDSSPVLLHLKPGVLSTTCKPVILRDVQGSKKLVTADVNNDRKFKFLSQVTKADYRHVEEREDKEQIKLMEQVIHKIHSTSENSSSPTESSVKTTTVTSLTTACTDEVENAMDYSDKNNEDTCFDVSEVDDIYEKILNDAPICAEESDDELEFCMGEKEEEEDDEEPTDERVNHEIESPLPDMTPPHKVERLRLSSSPYTDFSKSLEDVSSPLSGIASPLTLRSSARMETIESERSTCSTERRRPVDEPIEVETNPFKVCYENNGDRGSEAEEDVMMIAGSSELTEDRLSCENEEENGNSQKLTPEDEISHSYASDGNKLLENTIRLLEKHLSQADSRVKQLERLCEMQQGDMQSLRFEIQWKDERIEYLQKALAELETKHSETSSND